ncbi:MAG: ACT domain-containing protein [Gemmatimonadota bacterium]
MMLETVPQRLAVCRLDAMAPIPAWATGNPFFSVTRTLDELSVICDEAVVPADVVANRGWVAIRVVGVIDMSVVGVMLSLAGPLAEAGVSIMPVATYDTDYVLVRNEQLHDAMAALERAGHSFKRAADGK